MVVVVEVVVVVVVGTDVPNSGGRTPASQDSRRPRHPFPAVMAGVKPWPCPCAQGPTNSNKIHTRTSTTGTSTTVSAINGKISNDLQIGASTTLSTRNWGVSMVYSKTMGICTCRTTRDLHDQ